MSSERLQADIETNAEFGAIDTDEGRGRTVLTGSSADRAAREYFVERLEDAGLTVSVDVIGNIAGRWVPPEADPTAAPVAVGSHLDSVPQGGIFDGPLGVYGALEAVRALQESDITLDRPVLVVSWTEEEGIRFDTGLLGSAVAAGVTPLSEALSLQDDDGITVEAALEDIGFRGADTLDPAGWDAWFELHVEQGRELESAGASVGVVEAISGITNCRVIVSGEANHAGATQMYQRRDALAAASQFVLDVEQAARDVANTMSESAVGTVGNMAVSPNANNVVPGEVTLTVDVRDVDRAAMDRIVDSARASAARIERDRPVETEFDQYRLTEPSGMAERCVSAVVAAADSTATDMMRMHSAALHDTANLAEQTDTVLLFAPSRDGISHNPLEWTDWVDCATATRVLAGAIADVAAESAHIPE
ncbi:N-carbamoyl-L-amino acid amidohydrolase [Halosimplex carlsbadense 2-9-1]|uniref:N-carbamoyl-L-amino acid amidohydrolase n=1 Tax=Halosimplex carlsbadense 2-9-1 TaxID=797114 RepID=M0CYP2_9EURY|nr:N-carbamoyl-L-amino acid amidohydrolase [Halosimplex carlsbadense 2-9-1]